MIDAMTIDRDPIGRRDIAIALVVSVLGLLLMYAGVDYQQAHPEEAADQTPVYFGGLLPIGFAFVLFPLVTLPLLWRRAAPLAAAAAALAALALNELLVGTDLIRCGVVLPTAFLLAFTAGSLLDNPAAGIGLALTLGLTLFDTALEFGSPELVVIAVMTGVTVAMWGIGRIVRSRGRMADELRARTAELRAARDERARIEVASDRARLSGQLDELLERRLGELAQMADEGARSSDAAGAAASLLEIEHESRRTLEEMRGVVGVLRDEDSPTEPQPTLTHLEALLVRAEARDARLSVAGSVRALPAAVELSAYRIVEQLLDALQQAPDVEVCVHFGDDALELTVSGPARRRAKAQIERARERARLQQGTLEASVRGGRADVAVSLPLAATG